MNIEYYKRSLKTLMMFCLYLALARFTKGVFIGVMSLMGMVWAFNGKVGKSLSIYSMIIFMVSVNPFVLPMEGPFYGLGLRLGPLAIGLALMCRGCLFRSRQRLPLGMLLAYLVVAIVSSIGGWSPVVSFLKIVNFTVFMIGIWLGTQALEHDADGIMVLRATFFALAIFLIVGSIILMPFPGISTLSGLRDFRTVDDIAFLNAMYREAANSGAMSLFCGITQQSQTLSPMLACMFGWLVCDLLFVEEEFRWPHIILIVLSIPLLYKTRSRVALLTLMAALMLVYFYLPRHIQLRPMIKRWLRSMLLFFGFILVTVLAISEIHGDTFSRWIRKTNDVESDARSISEALTESRQGLIEECMSDFRRNPLLGSGFQVASFTEEYVKRSEGLVLSSPIEKGVLPIMVLGETGVVGVIVFAVFLISFVNGCGRRRLRISLAMMCLLLVTNFGEASFFSPGGVGGILWTICVVGGYALDMSLSEIAGRRSLAIDMKWQ